MARAAWRIALALLISAMTASASAHPVPVEREARAEIVDTSKALLASLPERPGTVEQLFGYSQRALARRPLNDPARRDWSYWPRPRAGLSLGRMTAEQRGLTHDLLAALLSAKGHLKVVQIMQLEEIQRALDASAFPRRIEDYVVLIFGEPSLAKPWSLRFEGHHVSINVAMAPSGEMTVTPLFLGAMPAEVPSGPMAGLRVLRREDELALRLVRSLDDRQRAIAVGPGEPPGEILASQFEKIPSRWGDWKRARLTEGLSSARMTESQRELLHQLVTEVAAFYRPELANEVLRKLGLSVLSFHWIGSFEPGKPHYYRVTGGSFWFEYDDSMGGSGHVHTVWRDRDSDLGEDILGDHYREAH